MRLIMNKVRLLLFLQIFGLFSIESFAQIGSCITTYTDLAIYGNDLNGVQGKPSSCCQLCQQKRGCKGWTWENFNGGTCWLKNDTQPLYKASQNGQITGIMSPDTANTYALNLTFDSTNFWDQPWHFDQWHSTNVTDKVNKTTAERLEMFGYRNGKIYMGAEHNLSYPHSGRPTVQIQSNYLFNSGLFVLSLDHMPTGPGVWPAFWMFGTNWPNDGEIDILEGVDNMTYNRVTIHTGNQCMMNLNDSVFFNGSWVNPKEYLECWQYFKPNATVQQGCSIKAPEGTFNTGFNHAGGGVFALQWEREKFLKIWNFVQPNVPDDISQENPNPNPDTWGLPTAYFKIGSNCSPSHFVNQTVVFDINLCGSWVDLFFPGGEAACEDTVKYHPEKYNETYWLINYLKVFCKPGEPCGFLNPQGCTFGC